MDIVLHHLIEDIAEVIALGAIAIVIVARIVERFDGPVEEVLGFLDLCTDTRQIGQLQRCTIFLDQVLDREVVESEISVVDIKSFLWEIKCLIDQVKVLVLHEAGAGAG